MRCAPEPQTLNPNTVDDFDGLHLSRYPGITSSVLVVVSFTRPSTVEECGAGADRSIDPRNAPNLAPRPKRGMTKPLVGMYLERKDLIANDRET
jgi:hypothetical protein